MKSKTSERRTIILKKIMNSKSPITASALAEMLNVSRQIIVGDIAILRALGNDILSTPNGYLISENESDKKIATIATKHSPDETRSELYAIVDNGGEALDVVVEHPIYGDLTGRLNLKNRHEVDIFCDSIKGSSSQILSSLTNGIHIHHISYRNEKDIKAIKKALDDKGFLNF